MNNVNSKGLWEHHVIGVLNTNCYVFGDPKNAIMIDPGGDEAIKIAEDLMKKEIEIKHVLVTHGHFDHLGWAWEVQKICEGANVYLHEGEKESYEPFLDRLKNIEIRTQSMMKENCIQEVKKFTKKKLSSDLTANKIIGVREIKRYLQGEFQQKTLVDLINIKTRQYAKRQKTWSRGHMADWHMIYSSNSSILLKKILNLIS